MQLNVEFVLPVPFAVLVHGSSVTGSLSKRSAQELPNLHYTNLFLLQSVPMPVPVPVSVQVPV